LLASVKEALGVIRGSAAGIVIAACGLAGILVATTIDPIAAAIASAALLVAIVAVFIFALRQRALFAGPYRVLDETITWEFVANDGHQAYVTKHQQVRFNYLVVAHTELASGDGSLFASFTCNYGKVISPFPRAGEEGILIQMTPERTRDEESVLTSRREILDGFIGTEQWITHRSSMPSKRTELIMQFPNGCKIENVRISGPSGHGSRPASSDELRTEGTKHVLRLKPRRYRANQSITVTWTW
jgi:hypothetical protein